MPGSVGGVCCRQGGARAALAHLLPLLGVEQEVARVEHDLVQLLLPRGERRHLGAQTAASPSVSEGGEGANGPG